MICIFTLFFSILKKIYKTVLIFMKKTYFILLFLIFSYFVSYAQTKQEIEKMLIENIWQEDIEKAMDNLNIEEIKKRGLVKEFYPIAAKMFTEKFTKDGLYIVLENGKKVSECDYSISEDGKYMRLKSNKNHDDKYPKFDYQLELKNVTKNSFEFGQSSDKQYRGFVGNKYNALQQSSPKF